MAHPLVVILVLPISIRFFQRYHPPPPPTFPAAGRKKSTFRKTIVLVSLTSTSTDKPSSSKSHGLNYTVVMQVVVTMEANNCSSGAAADLVKQQVGYEVILVSAAMFWILRPVEALSTGSLQEKSWLPHCRFTQGWREHQLTLNEPGLQMRLICRHNFRNNRSAKA